MKAGVLPPFSGCDTLEKTEPTAEDIQKMFDRLRTAITEMDESISKRKTELDKLVAQRQALNEAGTFLATTLNEIIFERNKVLINPVVEDSPVEERTRQKEIEEAAQKHRDAGLCMHKPSGKQRFCNDDAKIEGFCYSCYKAINEESWEA